MDIVSPPKVGHSLPKPSCLLWEALVCEKHIPKPAPNGTKNLPRHLDAAPWACQVSWISHEFWVYWNLKTRYLNVSGRVAAARFLTFTPISCMGPKYAPKDEDLIFNQFICVGACACNSNLIMHINALKSHLMHKNVQTNPEKSQKIPQHSCCSMLTWEKIWKQ